LGGPTAMYELVIRIETVCLDAGGQGPWPVGAGLIAVGLLLWLAGTRFSGVIVAGAMGAIGAGAGQAVAHGLSAPALWGLAGGAVVGGVLGLAFKNVVFFVVAVAVFALAAGGTYSSRVLERVPAMQSPANVESWDTLPAGFSRMTPAQRLAYVDKLAGDTEGLSAKIRAMIAEALDAIGPYKWRIVLALILGGLVAVVLIWLVERVVPPLCYSAVGVLLIFCGGTCLFAAAGRPLGSLFQGHPRLLDAVFLGLVGFGAIVQWVGRHRRARRLAVPTGTPEAETDSRNRKHTD